jgi:hypothetical protein
MYGEFRRLFFPRLMQIYTKFANFTGLYFTHFTTIRNQTLQFFSFEDALSSYGNEFRSSCLDQNFIYSWSHPFSLYCSGSCIPTNESLFQGRQKGGAQGGIAPLPFSKGAGGGGESALRVNILTQKI